MAVLLKAKETQMTDIFEDLRTDYLPEGTYGGHLLSRTLAAALATVELCKRGRQSVLAYLGDRTVIFNSVLHYREPWDPHRLTCLDHCT